MRLLARAFTERTPLARLQSVSRAPNSSAEYNVEQRVAVERALRPSGSEPLVALLNHHTGFPFGVRFSEIKKNAAKIYD
jgi:hypothetical protein